MIETGMCFNVIYNVQKVNRFPNIKHLQLYKYIF